MTKHAHNVQVGDPQQYRYSSANHSSECVRSGRHCDGYPAYRRSGEVTLPIAPRPLTGNGPSLGASRTLIAASTMPSPPQPRQSTVVQEMGSRVVRRSHPTPPPTPIKEESNEIVEYRREEVNQFQLPPTMYRPGGFILDSQEGQYFQLFRTHTASELSGFFDSDFWTRSVLQESHSEASIRHAVVALGALYKTLEKVAESPPGSPESNPTYHTDSAPTHYNFALQEYGKALTRMRESLERGERRSQRTILMSIVLFTCFQSFTGDHRAAITQIQSGLGLLEERRQDSRQPLIGRQDDVVEDELIQMFTRLAVQAKSYDMAFHFPEPYVIQLSPRSRDPTSPSSPTSPSDAASTSSISSDLPEVFHSTPEARTALDSLCERIMRFKEQLSTFHPGPNNILPASIRSSGAGFRIQLQQWGVAFEPLLQNRRANGVSNTERAGINVLKMFQLMTTILFLMGFSTSEMDFDGFMVVFREIVELAKELVVDEELSLAAARCGSVQNCRHQRSPTSSQNLSDFGMGDSSSGNDFSHIKASFALDLGIVPPLFVVATKCRARKLRREAIRLLLSSPRREGMWDSILCGKAAQWIMEVEEEGLRTYEAWDPVGINEQVKEDRRVMVKEILFDLQRREAMLSCGTRGMGSQEHDGRKKEKYITW